MAQQPKLHVKTGDKVKVITGKDKGSVGEIIKAYPDQERVLVQGINNVTKHMKPSQDNPQGGIEEFEAPIHVSNVMLVDPKSEEPTRVGFKIENGQKVRIAKKSGEVIDK